MALVPVTATLALKALARCAGAKRASMVAPADAERLTGCVTGGISPFGLRRRLPVYLDESALGFDTIHLSGGQRGLEVSLSPGAVLSSLDATVASLTT